MRQLTKTFKRISRKKTLEKIVVVKHLARCNLAFRGKKEKIYESNIGKILSIIEMIAEFDAIMQQHVR